MLTHIGINPKENPWCGVGLRLFGVTSPTIERNYELKNAFYEALKRPLLDTRKFDAVFTILWKKNLSFIMD